MTAASMTPQELLQVELDDARGLLYQIEMLLDADHITEAQFFANELVETLYLAQLIASREPSLLLEPERGS